MRVLGEQCRRHRIADAAVAAGDNGDLISKTKVHVMFRVLSVRVPDAVQREALHR